MRSLLFSRGGRFYLGTGAVLATLAVWGVVDLRKADDETIAGVVPRQGTSNAEPTAPVPVMLVAGPIDSSPVQSVCTECQPTCLSVDDRLPVESDPQPEPLPFEETQVASRPLESKPPDDSDETTQTELFDEPFSESDGQASSSLSAAERAAFVARYATAAKQLDCRDSPTLLRELAQAPEVTLQQTKVPLPPEFFGILPASKRVQRQPSESFLRCQHLQGLPFRFGSDCELDDLSAAALTNISDKLAANPREILKPGICRAEYVPGLMQKLQSASFGRRVQLVQVLTATAGREASAALARIALFDPSKNVRRLATEQLLSRPPAEYQATLVKGLRYPWPPVAKHAAAALVALELRDSLDELRKLESEPDPTITIVNEDVRYVSQLVRINHRANCMLCHAISYSKADWLRGFVPQEPSPPVYYEQTTRDQLAVRADVTYLRQDFSVEFDGRPTIDAKVKGRFDYLLRSVELTPAESANYSKRNRFDYPQRKAVRYALGRLAGDSTSWAVLTKHDSK